MSQFSQLLFVQILKSGTVLESWKRAVLKTVPDFEIWPRFDGEIEEKRNGQYFYGHSVHTSDLDLHRSRLDVCWYKENDFHGIYKT